MNPAVEQAGWGPVDPAWFHWAGEIHCRARPYPEPWSGWFYDQDGRHVIVYRSTESMLAGESEPICGSVALEGLWVCSLPPGHETRHLPTSDRLVLAGFRVSHISTTTQSMAWMRS